MVMPRFLTVDHERITARDVAPGFPTLGYTVDAFVGSGREAVQPAGNLRPDWVPMDIGLLEKLDGLATDMA